MSHKRTVGSVTIRFVEYSGGPRRSVDDLVRQVSGALDHARGRGEIGPMPYAEFEITSVTSAPE